MQIFVPRLTKGTSQGDLYRLAREVLASRIYLPFAKRAEIRSCDILKITDRNGATEYHGLISITPDKAALWFIRKIRGMKLHGKLLIAREYHVRMDAKEESPTGENRRRSDLSVNKISAERVSIEGLDQFKQEHR